MTITLELDDEQFAALVDHAAAEGDRSAEAFLARFATTEVVRITAQAFDAAAERLISGARALPYAARKDLISMVHSKLEGGG